MNILFMVAAALVFGSCKNRQFGANSTSEEPQVTTSRTTSILECPSGYFSIVKGVIPIEQTQIYRMCLPESFSNLSSKNDAITKALSLTPTLTIVGSKRTAGCAFGETKPSVYEFTCVDIKKPDGTPVTVQYSPYARSPLNFLLFSNEWEAIEANVMADSISLMNDAEVSTDLQFVDKNRESEFSVGVKLPMQDDRSLTGVYQAVAQILSDSRCGFQSALIVSYGSTRSSVTTTLSSDGNIKMMGYAREIQSIEFGRTKEREVFVDFVSHFRRRSKQEWLYGDEGTNRTGLYQLLRQKGNCK